MLNWLFKKRGDEAAPTSPPATPGKGAGRADAGRAGSAAGTAKASATTPAKAPAKSRSPEVDRAEWDARLQAAQGDDAALLALALNAPQWQIKLAAVQAIRGEDTLKQAERALRHHDGRVHGAARQRLQADAARRATAVKAAALIDAAAALAQEQPLPVNHLVALDHDWAALAAVHLTPEQSDRFAELRGRLDALLRAQDEARQEAQQRAAAEVQALAEAEARRIAEREDAERAAEQAAERFAEQPAELAAEPSTDHIAEGPGDLARDATGVVAGDVAGDVASDAASGDPAATDPASTEATSHATAEGPAADDSSAADPVAGGAAAREATRRAARRPDPAQLAALDTLLQQAEAAAEAGQSNDLQQQLQAIDAALPALHGAALDGRRRQRLQALQAESTRLRGWQRWGGSRARDELVEEAEALARLTLLATGSMPPPAPAAAPTAVEPAAAIAPADAVDSADAAAPAPPPQALTSATEPSADVDGGTSANTADDASVATPADGSADASDVPSSDALAGPTTDHSTATATAAPAAPAQRDSPAARRNAAPKLALKAHGEAIQTLRKRWKDLDRLGAAANQTLWRRFDAALHTAYQPVAVHLAALQAERQANLAARQALLDTLDGVGSTEAPGAPATAGDAEAAAGEPDGQDASSLREQLRALDRFHTAWRQLGPLEHTVPAQSRNALQQRLQRSVARLEAPIELARRVAAAEREALIQRAQALLPAPGREPREPNTAPPRDAALRVRELQAQWQQQARGLPLARPVETALWARFKAATDAVFAQREAAFSARDAELGANLAAREALLQRLAELRDDATAAELQRALAEADRAWHEPIELPRAAVAAVEARHRELRAVLSQRLSGAAQRDWQAQCEQLAARLALCEAREQGASEGVADSVEAGDAPSRRWDAMGAPGVIGALPASWAQALSARWTGAVAPGPLPEAAFDDLLLELEARLELPATAEQQAARRQLKLHALKHALEGRGAATVRAPLPADPLAAALRQAGATPAQRERLHRLVAALRQAPAGSTLGGAR